MTVWASSAHGMGTKKNQNRMPNSMQGSLWFLDPFTHLYLTGMPGHSAQELPGSITEDEWIQRRSLQFGLCLLGQNRWVLKAITHLQWAQSWWEDALDTIRLGAVASDGHVFAVLLGLLPSMGFDRWMDIEGSLPSTQRPLAQTWACGCPPSELSMPLTSHRGMGPCRLWTRSHCWWCLALPQSSVSQEIVCFRPQRSLKAGRDQLLCMPMGEPRRGWKDLLPRLQLKGGFRWQLLCLALQENRQCGPVWVSAQLQEQPLTSGCYLPVFLKGKNYLCSRAGNSGTPLGSRALPCPNGLLELMWTLDRMGVTPLPIWSRTSMPKRQLIFIPSCPPTYLGRLGGEWPIPQSHQPACTENHNLWVPTGSHPCNLLSLSYRVFASQVPPWPVEWSGQVAWWHQTCCHYPEWSRVGRCQNHTFQIGERGGWGGIPAWGGGMVERTELPFHHPSWLLSFTAECGAWRGNPTAPPRNLACGGNGTW